MKKSMLFGIIGGIIGVAASAAIFVAMVVMTNRIFGIVAVLCGALAGAGFGVGLVLGGGKIRSRNAIKGFLLFTTIFGFLGVIAAYLGPYLYFAGYGVGFSAYWALLEFGFLDLLFMALGAYGGRWAGSRVLHMIIIRDPENPLLRRAAVRMKKASN